MMILRILRIVLIMCLIIGGAIWSSNLYLQKIVSSDSSTIDLEFKSVSRDILRAQQRLAYCSAVLAYAIKYNLLQNEIGKAKLLAKHYGWTYGALIYINIADYRNAINRLLKNPQISARST